MNHRKLNISICVSSILVKSPKGYLLMSLFAITDNKTLRGVIFKIQPLKEPVNFQLYDLCTNFKSTPQRHVKSPTFWNFLDFIKNLTHQDFFSKFKISCEKKLLLVSSMGYLSIKILTKKKFQNSKIFTSKMGRVWNEKKNQNIICPSFLESRISTTI